MPSATEPPSIVRVNAKTTTPDALHEIISRDGGVIIENLISSDLASRIRSDLKPHFEADQGDASGFFPTTTRRATALLGISDACVELALNPLYSAVAEKFLTSEHTYWLGQEQRTSISKPQISSTVAFRVQPGSKAQGLHRDDIDYHVKNGEGGMMMECVTAITKTTRENGATVVIPGSHTWGDERCPTDEEAVAAELNPGEALIFLGSTYHAGGGNVTKDEARETVGIFLCKGVYRQVENQYFAVPPETAKRLSPKAQRLLGYGISPPFCGFMNYKDPMGLFFGVKDDETVVI
ncbi:phytanoyl-CoA dioxygenase family protein [Aspergillus stella-maris]|uniref:phytanoyl-CoA dioxygenase family protein n=1 Tax=Aspergillus stella-maris TaxID=1810926 RepID=UPI003CCE4861